MMRKKQAQTNGKPIYETVGRGTLTTAGGGATNSPLYKGYVGIDKVGFFEIVLFPPKDGASEKTIATGFAKATPSENAPVMFYLTLIENHQYDNSPCYALGNIPREKREGNTPPDFKLAVYYRNNAEGNPMDDVYDIKVMALPDAIERMIPF